MPGDKRYELIGGEFFVVTSPNEHHQRISRELEYALLTYVKKNKSGFVYYAPFDVVFSDEDVVQPDIVFVSEERKNIIAKDNIQGPPDLIVEIISPKTGYRDRGIKRKLYCEYGVKEYWIVDPAEQTVEVLTFIENDYKTENIYPADGILYSPLLKGLEIDLNIIFS